MPYGTDFDNTTSSDGLTGLTESPVPSTYIEPSSPQKYESLYSLANPLVDKASRSTKDTSLDDVPQVRNPSLGSMLLVGLLKGDVNSFASRYRAQQAAPIVGKLRLEIGKALTEGNDERAEQLMGGLSSLTQYSPQAVELYKDFSTQITNRRKDKQTVDATLGSLDIAALAKDNPQAAMDLARLSQDARRTPDILKQVLANNELSISESGGVISKSNKLYGTFRQDVTTPTVLAEKYTKAKLDAITLLRLNPNTIASLENKISRNQATPEEKDLYNSLIPRINAQAEHNERLEKLPASTGIQLNLPQGSREEITTAPELRDTSPPPITSTPLPQPGTGKFLDEATVDKYATAYEKSGKGTYEDGVVAMMRTADARGLSPEQKARESDIAGNTIQRYRETKAQQRGLREERPQSEQSIAVKMDSKGNLATATNLRQADIDKEYALFNQPVEERKIFSSYGSLKEQARSLTKQIQDAPEHVIPDDKSSLSDKLAAWARRVSAHGVNVPFTIAGYGANVSGAGNIALNRDEARIYNKLAILMREAEHVYNIKEKDDPRLGDLRAMVTGTLASRDTILNTIQDITEAAEDHVRGILRANNPNSVQEPDRKPHMPGTAPLLGVANPPNVPSPTGPVSTPPPAQPNTPIPLSQEDIAGATQIDIGNPPLPDVTQYQPAIGPPRPLERSVGPPSPLGTEPRVQPGRQVSGQLTVPQGRSTTPPVPVRAGEDITPLRVPIGGSIIQRIYKSFKEDVNDLLKKK